MPVTLSEKQYENRVLTKVELGFNNEESTPAIEYIVMNSKGVQPSADMQELITQGTTSKAKHRQASSYTLTIDQDYYMAMLDEISYVKGGTSFFGTGITPGTFYEIRLTHEMIDSDTGATVSQTTRFLKCNVSARDPQSSQAEAIAPDQVVFEAQKTSVDLLGASITNMPAGGAFFIKSPIA